MFRLKLKRLDDEPEEKDFATEQEAIDYAVQWFLGGYDNETIGDSDREMALEDSKEIPIRLRQREEFCCSNFYENIILIDLGQQMQKEAAPVKERPS